MSTDAMRDYLAEAYRIAYYQGDDPFISTSALAEAKGVSAPAVTRMVQRLKDAGFLDHEPYRGIRLTPIGERSALEEIRKHRIVERFLVDVLGIGWHEVHEHADLFGENASPQVIARMYDMAGKPRRCPHGEPIPTADGKMPRAIDYPLHEVAVGQEYVLSRVNTHDADKLRYLDLLGLKPSRKLFLVERAPFHGPLQVRLENDDLRHFIGYELAESLRVCSETEFRLI